LNPLFQNNQRRIEKSDLSAEDSVQETVHPHLPVGQVHGDQEPGDEIGVAYLSHGTQVIYILCHRQRAPVCMDISC